jgi:2-polyprenyl-3-methyl-5-hydroxy-6-metoxy-1,4-benzoquinol methylase
MDALIPEILRLNPMQADFLTSAVSSLEEGERRDLESYLEYARSLGLRLEYLAACYDVIVKDTLAQQIYFRRHGRYRHSSYADVAGDVYRNPEYMAMYMHGLAITAYLWPNHRAMRRWFDGRFPEKRSGDYLEIGPGHGFYFMEAIRRGGYSRYLGVDISETSVDMTRRILDSGFFGKFGNWEVQQADFLSWRRPDRRFQAVVMGEVLEHVEDPGAFLRKIREVSMPGAFIYATTCINAAAVDHIFLFRSKEDVFRLVESQGLSVRDFLLLPYNGLSVEESERKNLPMNIALVLEHA